MTPPDPSPATRVAPRVAWRTAAAVVGGYLLASALAALLAAVLPMRRADAVTAGMQFSFAVYALAAVWAFSPVPVGRVWATMLGGSLLLGVFAWLLR